MNFRRRRKRLRLIALGLATAALGASSAQAAPVIPYLSQGQGLTAEQWAQFETAGGPASGAFGNPAGTVSTAKSERSLQSNDASIPCIAVGGRCIDIRSKTVADSANSVASRYDDHRGEVIADAKTSVAGRYMDHRGEPVADSTKSSTALNDRIHSRPLPSPADEPSGTATGNDDGFNWGDASVGAGSTLALVLLAGMAAFTIRRSRGNQLAGT